MNATLLSTIAGALLSLLFAYTPGLAGWYERLGQGQEGGTRKRLVMLAALLAAAGGSFGLACLGIGDQIGLKLTCDRPGLVELIQAVVYAVMANQSVHRLSPRRATQPGPSGR